MAKNTPIKVGKDGFPGSKKVLTPKEIPGVVRTSPDPKVDNERIVKLLKDSNKK